MHVDAEAKVAYVGGGATWDDVNYAAIKYGLATPGGTIGEVSSSLLVRAIHLWSKRG